jgi:hypothetical protein
MKWLEEEVQLSEESGRQSPGVPVREVEEQRKLMLLVSGQTREPGKKEKYAGNVRLLLTVPGTGLLTAMRFLAEIENINRFEDTDHFAAYPGLVPNRHNSGEVKNDGEMTRRVMRLGYKLYLRCYGGCLLLKLGRNEVLGGSFPMRSQADKSYLFKIIKDTACPPPLL